MKNKYSGTGIIPEGNIDGVDLSPMTKDYNNEEIHLDITTDDGEESENRRIEFEEK